MSTSIAHRIQDKDCEQCIATANKNKKYLQECMGCQRLTTRTALTLSVCLVLASLGLEPSDELGDGELLGENSVRGSAASRVSDGSGR